MKKIRVMLAGLPGKMASLVADAVTNTADGDMEICSVGLSEIAGCVRFNSYPVYFEPVFNHENVLLRFRERIDVIVDFTLPKSVNRNTELYCKVGVPFVMGTTGGDRRKLVEAIKDSPISAVVATNMAIPVVLFQSMFRFAAENFKGSLAGFKLAIRESHQAQKPDPSGTAVSLLEFFDQLGVPFKKEQIIMERRPEVQEVELGIPAEHLDGHAYHTYTFLSPDGTVVLKFSHNILGRNVYVDGVLKAIRFLASKEGTKGTVFSMVDVLKGKQHQ